MSPELTTILMILSLFILLAGFPIALGVGTVGLIGKYWNGVRMPVAAIIGLAVLGYALLSMYSTYRGDIGELQRLVLLVGVSVAVVLLRGVNSSERPSPTATASSDAISPTSSGSR